MNVLLGLVLGIIFNLMVSVLIHKAPRTPTHVHEWSKWKMWAITYQSRKCLTCGIKEIREF